MANMFIKIGPVNFLKIIMLLLELNYKEKKINYVKSFSQEINPKT